VDKKEKVNQRKEVIRVTKTKKPVKNGSGKDDYRLEGMVPIADVLNSFLRNPKFRAAQEKMPLSAKPEFVGAFALGKYGKDHKGEPAGPSYVAALYRVDPRFADRVRKLVYEIPDLDI
jgi:hypothetical protein